MVAKNEIRNWMIEACKEGRLGDVPEHLRERVKEWCGRAVKEAKVEPPKPFRPPRTEESSE